MRQAIFWIMLVVFLLLAGAGTMFVLLQYSGRLMPAMDQGQGLPTGSAKDFTDGNGIYYYNDGKYNFLTWKKKLFTPGAPPEERDIAEAARSAIPVKQGVRFFSYGLDFSKWPVVPPYAMAFCIIRDVRTVEGVPLHQACGENRTDLRVAAAAIDQHPEPERAVGDQLSIFMHRRLGIQVPIGLT